VNVGDYIYWCSNGICRCTGSACGTTSQVSVSLGITPLMSQTLGNLNDYRSTNADMGWSFYYTSSFIATFCLNNLRYVYSDASNNLVGGLVDFISQTPKVALGATVASVQQGCLATFDSGSKDDKDACRDSLTDECGIEVDFRCRKSGLYDYINRNPVAAREVPTECDLNAGSDDTCFNWIAKNYFLGSITLKPSGFLSINLSIESSVNANSGVQNSAEVTEILPTTNVQTNFYNDPTYGDIAVNALVNGYINTSYDADLVVDGAYVHTFPDSLIYMTEVTHEANEINNNGRNLQFSIMTLMIVVLAGILL